MEVRKTRQRLMTLEVLARLGVSHGFEIASKAGLQLGTVYGVLMRFEQDGAVTSRWDDHTPAGRPRRRLYELTGQGQALLVEYRNHFPPQARRGWLEAASSELHTAIDEVWGGLFRAGTRPERERQASATVRRERTTARLRDGHGRVPGSDRTPPSA